MAVEPARGLFVGRLERRAWLGQMRGDGSFERLTVNVHWDASRIDPADLVLEHSQYRNQELASRSRLPFEDCEGFSNVRDAGSGDLTLDMIGPRLAYEIMLLTRDGECLDRVGPYHFVEQISISFGPRGATGGHTTTVGQTRRYPVSPRELSPMRRLGASCGRCWRERPLRD